MPHTCTQGPKNFGFTLGNDLVPPNLFLTPFPSSLAQKLCQLAVSGLGPSLCLLALLMHLRTLIWITRLTFPILTGSLPCFLAVPAQPSPLSRPLAGLHLPSLWGSSYNASRFSWPIFQENCLITLKTQNISFSFYSLEPLRNPTIYAPYLSHCLFWSLTRAV